MRLLDQSQCRFRLWQQAEGDCAKAAALVPASWPDERRSAHRADPAAFLKIFIRIIGDETVLEDNPFVAPYEELEIKQKKSISQKVKSIRAKLNVPPERFHLRNKTQYF